MPIGILPEPGHVAKNNSAIHIYVTEIIFDMLRACNKSNQLSVTFRACTRILPTVGFHRCISSPSDLTKFNSSLPTNKTTVILRKIPSHVTQSSLQSALREIETCRKVELEPGCVIHFSNEASAERTSTLLKSKLNCEVYS